MLVALTAGAKSELSNIALGVKAVIHPFAKPGITYSPADLGD